MILALERIERFAPSYDAPFDSIATVVATDLVFLNGLSHAAIGGYLLWAARRARASANIVPLILAMELIVGIDHNLHFLILRDYPVDGVYYGFIVLHSVIIVSGYLVYPRDR